MEIFQQAALKKVRFTSKKGQILVEDLFDLPMTELNNIGTSLLKAVRDEEVDFSEFSSRPSTTDNKLKLEIVRAVVAYIKDRNAAKANAAANAETRQILREALAQKKIDGIKALSEQELEERLKALN